MNCKPGDLAVVVKSGLGGVDSWVGRIIKVIGLCQGPAGPCWTYEGARLSHPIYGDCEAVSDKCLRPIRPGEGEDEMLLLAGKPTEVTA